MLLSPRMRFLGRNRGLERIGDIEKLDDYSATLVKRERVNGKIVESGEEILQSCEVSGWFRMARN